MREAGDFGVVSKPQNLPAPGGFKLPTNRCGIHASLQLRPIPILGLHNRLPLAVTCYAERPPIAEPPRNAALYLAEQFACRAPFPLGHVRRQFPTDAQHSSG